MQELFSYLYNECNHTALETEMLEILQICAVENEKRSWTYCIDKDAPLEAEIIFENKAGKRFAGIRTLLHNGVEYRNPVYVDYYGRKNRYNIVKWKLI